jgi:hypothetical protein
MIAMFNTSAALILGDDKTTSVISKVCFLLDEPEL